MLAMERRNRILRKLAMDGKVIVSDLSRKFEVSEETIRRDLEKLHNEGLARKTYGGAVAVSGVHPDLPYTVRKRSNVAAKQKIAARIAALIPDGSYLMLDASSTALFVTKYIKEKRGVTLITNSVEILLELADKKDWNILSTGGALREGALSLVGASAEKMISGFHVDIAVCSCKGLDLQMGVTDSNEKDAEIKQAIFAAADRRILAADATKFDQRSFVRVCGVDGVDVIVTDQKPSDAWCEYLRIQRRELLYGEEAVL